MNPTRPDPADYLRWDAATKAGFLRVLRLILASDSRAQATNMLLGLIKTVTLIEVTEPRRRTLFCHSCGAITRGVPFPVRFRPCRTCGSQHYRAPIDRRKPQFRGLTRGRTR